MSSESAYRPIIRVLIAAGLAAMTPPLRATVPTFTNVASNPTDWLIGQVFPRTDVGNGAWRPGVGLPSIRIHMWFFLVEASSLT